MRATRLIYVGVGVSLGAVFLMYWLPSDSGSKASLKKDLMEGKATAPTNVNPFFRPLLSQKYVKKVGEAESPGIRSILELNRSGNPGLTAREVHGPKEDEALRKWEEARQTDSQNGTNQPLREREELLIQKVGTLRLGMNPVEVIRLLGQPVRIDVRLSPQTTVVTQASGGLLSVTQNRTKVISPQEHASETNAVFYIYSPHPERRSFNKPWEEFQVLTVGFDVEHKVMLWKFTIPHQTAWTR